ncbi:MAG: aminotransferase class I/II-fold pyridoxal phosphate-dependent enzyme [Alphaproteobacteria bacterium]|nr:aminotransferase class I/II-fold pyridoxal phosphate-dependent enzyme [Alphaproteobacteria bacterium]
MPHDRLEQGLKTTLADKATSGTLKGEEDVITGVLPAQAGHGPRYLLKDENDRPFLRMNANAYLGMGLRREIVEAEEAAVQSYGAGPGAVRFISGTYLPHIELEHKLAAFHKREAAMIFSSAYATIMGLLPPLITKRTIVLSDALNHNCIINAVRLADPGEKAIYGHLGIDELDQRLEQAAGRYQRAIIVTDGIFSMRGDHAPLDEIAAMARRHDQRFPENVLLVVDDSHGVGAFGATGRGTEEHTGTDGVDLLVGTLGKAIGVNGGYVVGSRTIVDYLRETSPFYIYSNPITPAEAAAALRALDLLDSQDGLALLQHLQSMTERFRKGLTDLGFETVEGAHPVVPLMTRDTAKTKALVSHLRSHGILATGLAFPVVPKGDEEIRFQISADHTAADIDHALDVLAGFDKVGT